MRVRPVWYNALFGSQWTDDSVSSSSQKLLDDIRPTAGLLLSKLLASFEFKCVAILALFERALCVCLCWSFCVSLLPLSLSVRVFG